MGIYVKNNKIVTYNSGIHVGISGEDCCCEDPPTTGRCCKPSGCEYGLTAEECAEEAMPEIECYTDWSETAGCPDNYCLGWCCYQPDEDSSDECIESTCYVCHVLDGTWGGFGSECEESPCYSTTGTGPDSSSGSGGSSPGDGGGGGDYV